MAPNSFPDTMATNKYPYVYFDLVEPWEAISFRSLPSRRIGEFYKSVDSVIQKDSGSRSFGFAPDFLEMNCIDMDYVVNAIGGEESGSVDALISVGNYDAVMGRFSNQRWLMVELKLNSTVAQDDKRDLEKKVDGTLSHISDGPIDSSKIFVYPDCCVAAKKRKFLTWKNGTNKQIYQDWRCFSTKDFEEFLLLCQNIPYRVINQAQDILNSFPDHKDIEGIDRQFKFWRAVADDYYLKGNRQEYTHILSVLAGYFRNLREELDDSEDVELLSLEFDWDFLEKFLQSENE